MWTKQHQSFCNACGRSTKHVTHFQKDATGALIADARCTECPESSEVAA